MKKLKHRISAKAVKIKMEEERRLKAALDNEKAMKKAEKKERQRRERRERKEQEEKATQLAKAKIINGLRMREV